MAQLNKMMIQGIRSFGPDDNDKQMMSFISPLTLILGQNGCGKTTIIEALKFAITGDLPPGGKLGHSFIYDPKLARQPEVLGKVQLKLSDVKEKELVVTRCIQVTQKKSTMQFKTIDTSISRRGPDGKPVQTSGRCVDVDIEMSTSMGVSKSVINNVILCHQEESMWPLDEPKKLKERFDSIFDTVKYNKCLIQITDIRKTIKSDLTVLKSTLGHLLDKKQAAARMNEAIKDTEGRINVAQDQVDKCQSRCLPIQERLEEIKEQENNALQLLTNTEKIQTQLKNIREQQIQLKQKIPKRFEGTIEDLKDAIMNFDSQVREKEGTCRDLNTRMETVQKEEDKFAEEENQMQKKIGQLEIQQQNYEKEIQSRNRCLKKLCEDLNIEESFQETNLLSIMNQVEQKITEENENLLQLQNDLEEEIVKHQNRLDSLRDTKVKKEQEMKMKEQQIEAKTITKSEIHAEIKEVEKAANRLAQVEKDLDEVKANLESVTGEVNIPELEGDIKRFEDDEQRVNQELEKVYQEVMELQKHSETRTRLSMKQTDLNKKETEFNKLKNKTSDTLKHLLHSIPEVGLKRKFDECLEQIIQDINSKNQELRNIQNDISKLEENRRHKKEMLNVKEKEAKEDEEKIYDCCGDRDLDDVINDLSDKIQEMNAMKGMLASQDVLFQKYIRKLQERDPCCPLCHRSFEHSEEPSSLIEELSGEIRSVPHRLRNNDEELARSKKEYDMLMQLKPTKDRLKNVNETVIPKLKKELKEVVNQLDAANEKSRELRNDLMTPQIDEGMARGIQADVSLMDKYQSEIRICKTEISKLQGDIPPTVSTRNLEEAMKEQDDLRKEITELRNSIKSSKCTLDAHLNKIQKLREKKNKLVEEQLKIQGGTQQLQQMRENLAKIEVEIGDLEEQVQLLKSDVVIVKKDCDDARRDLDMVKNDNKTRIKKEECKVNDFKDRHKDIGIYKKKLDEYQRQGISANLAATKQALVDLELRKQAVKTRHQELAGRIDKLRTEISGQKVHYRELTDNLQLLEKEIEERKLADELAALTKKHGLISHTYNEIRAEKAKLEENRDIIKKESQQAEGRVEEMKKHLKALRKEMAEEMYEDAGDKYSKTLREKMVKEMVDLDLAKYYKAMEWTMTQFHQERMKAINDIISDLWRSIYRGNDIDFIKIEANTPDTVDTAKRRSYDYRVVQVKNDIEIDMRGRCSAGQKVLACLIIRLALAETLSSKCGILALDEPTTNLDRENIESLAEAFARIVNTRMVNKGFQLICITHDEEFVHHLKQRANLSHYYVVSRNEEGKSRITKHSVN